MNIAAEIVKWAIAHPHLATILGLCIVGGTVVVVTDTTDKVKTIVMDTTSKAENIAKDMNAQVKDLVTQALDIGYEFEMTNGSLTARKPNPQISAPC